MFLIYLFPLKSTTKYYNFFKFNFKNSENYSIDYYEILLYLRSITRRCNFFILDNALLHNISSPFIILFSARKNSKFISLVKFASKLFDILIKWLSLRYLYVIKLCWLFMSWNFFLGLNFKFLLLKFKLNSYKFFEILLLSEILSMKNYSNYSILSLVYIYLLKFNDKYLTQS